MTLSSGEVYTGDVVVGADGKTGAFLIRCILSQTCVGLRSSVRDYVLGFHVDPEPTGDMAYRMTIPRERIEQLDDPYWTPSLQKNISRNWWGPDSHAVVYPVRNKTVWNLLLIRPDDLPPDTMTTTADVLRKCRGASKDGTPSSPFCCSA